MRTWRIVSRKWTVLIALVIAATAAMLGVFVAPGHSVTPQAPPVAALTTGNGGNDPSYLFGLAEDTVQSVALTVDGNDVPVSMNNSVAYAAFPNTAKAATVIVTSTDGSKHTDSVSLQPAGTKP
jgi:hypothetical protein